jgi:hypothetical protein
MLAFFLAGTKLSLHIDSALSTFCIIIYYLPEAIIQKRKQDFSELVLKYADIDSNLLHTPQSLFSMLYSEHVL